MLHDGPDIPIEELDAADGVLTTAAVGIAATGTIVLDHTAGQGRRAASLVPDLHVCVVHADQVVHGLAEAVAVLDPYRPQTWISRAQRHQRHRTRPRRGRPRPRTLHVLLIEPDLR